MKLRLKELALRNTAITVEETAKETRALLAIIIRQLDDFGFLLFSVLRVHGGDGLAAW